jgi:hypothetical protein
MTRRSSAAPAPALTIPKIPPTQVLSRLAALHAAPIATLKRKRSVEAVLLRGGCRLL